MNYAKYCGPQRVVRELAEGEAPPLGAHLVTPWLGYSHHGIYAGEGKVIHYGALMYDIIRRPVEEVTLASFAEGRAIFVVRHTEKCFSATETIRRARSRLGEKNYRLLSNNCEHFVEWCMHDVHRSFQVDTALNFPSWFGERLLARVWHWAQGRAKAATGRVALATSPARKNPLA